MYNKRTILTIFLIMCLYPASIAFAQDFSPIETVLEQKTDQPVELNIVTEQILEDIKSSAPQEESFYNFANATDRFVQCNIRASWDDFKHLINASPKNDFIYISLSNKMAELGFFDLAQLASSKIEDKTIGNIPVEAMKRYYYPRKKLNFDDEMFLAEAYSNILYNDQSSEAINELLRNEELLSRSDYANYLVSLGYYKSNVFPEACKYINIATIQNPSNFNYQSLKAKILAEGKEKDDAVKIVDNLKKQKLYSYEYERKIRALEQFILYKTKTAQWEKDYHLGYYYYLENEDAKAIRTLQSALSNKRKCKAEKIYALMSEIYLKMNEFEKAADTASKAYKDNKNNPKTLITLGDIDYRNKNYKSALKYYKSAAAKDKLSSIPLVRIAQTYQKLSDNKMADEVYTKILKTHFDSWEAYYNVAMMSLDKEKKTVYLKKALAINPLYKDAWLDLSKTELERGNYSIAQKYLDNAFYIDENDYRYYYYQGLLNRDSNNSISAIKNFQKSLKLNSQCEDAQIELNKLLQKIQIKQDTI